MSPTQRPRLDLTKLLAPRSIAVIGASDQPGNLGGVAVGLLRRLGYPGEIWPVNPKRTDVNGVRCYPSVADLPGTADLAIIATAADSVAQRVADCAAAGIRHGIAWAGGFAEIGGDGIARQAKLTESCRAHDFLLAGPNCIGIVDTHLPMTASFASFLLETQSLLRGSISMVSQSGGLATMAQALAQKSGFGFRYTISSGNEAIITIADYIEALVDDPHTKVIAIYLEGVRDGPRFLEALHAARAVGKPVVMLKGGGTEASARAVASHTGALAGEKRVWEAVFREAGAIQVHSLEELLDASLFLSSTDLAKLPRGPGLAMITTGGGSGVLSADQSAVNGLTAPRLSPATQAALRLLVPPIAAIDNPVDLTPQVYNQAEWFQHFGTVLDVIAADPAVDIVLVQFGPMGNRAFDVAREICDFRERCAKTVCIAWSLAPQGVPEALLARGVHVFQEYQRAIATLGRLARAGLAAPAALRVAPPPLPFDWARFVPAPRAGLVISEHRCHEILAAAGMDVAAGRLARTAAEAVEAASAVTAPVAMKGISPSVTHRAAAGLLRLGLRAPEEIRQAFDTLSARAASAGVTLDGVYVQHMVAGGTEILLSAFRDPIFGPVASCGAGGNLTELIDDVVLERAPIDVATATSALQRLRIVGKVKQSSADLRRLAETLSHLSRLAAAAPWRRFVLEINPVKWGDGYVTAVDGLLIIEEP